MAVRLNDEETEKFVIARGLLTPEKLAPFRVQVAVDASGTLFDLLVSEKIITPEMLAELQSSMPQPAPPPPLRSIASGSRPTSFLQRSNAPPAPASASPPAATSPPAAPPRRMSRIHSFDEMTARRPDAQTPPQGNAVPPTPSTAAIPAISSPTSSQQLIAIGAIPAPKPHLSKGWPGGVAPASADPRHIQRLLSMARESGASDVYLAAGAPPMLRVHGQSHLMESAALASADVEALLHQAMTAEQWQHLAQHGDLAFTYAFADGGRFRCSAQRGCAGIAAAFRVIASAVPGLAELGLPPGVAKLTQYTDGLLLFSGPRGSGKSTTLASFAQTIAQARMQHILSFEDPVEFQLNAYDGELTQREIGSHTLGVRAAFESAMLEDPDTLLFGELRDPETTMLALSAAEAGFLVLATVQAQDTARTIDRVIESAEDAATVRNMLADGLRAIVSQQLIPRKDGQGRALACELLINSISVGNIIREAKTQNLINIMQTGRQQGMIMLDDSIRALVDAGTITAEESLPYCKNRAAFKQYTPPAKDAAAKPQDAQKAPGASAAKVPEAPKAPAPPRR